MNAMEVATADRRFEQLIERREHLIERSRFGVLAINGASTIGILSIYQQLQSALNVDPRYALILFAIGMISAFLSIFFETNFLAHRTAEMFGYLSALRNIRATLDDRSSESSEERLREQLNALAIRAKHSSITKIDLDNENGTMPNDFAFSPWALICLNFSAGAWISGVLAVVASMVA